MPQNRQAIWHFIIILLSVPFQCLIVTYFGSSSSEAGHQFKELISWAEEYKDKYLSWETWQNWCYAILKRVASFKSMQNGQQSESDDGESLAIEVLKYKNPKGYFGMSVEPRSPRPKHVKYRVGQVIRHKHYNYRGVIVGWDAEGKAPENWMENSSPLNKEKWKTQPNYSILVDARDRSRSQMAYVAEEFLEVLKNAKIIHPELDTYFEEFDGLQYLPRPRLKVLYPED